MPRTGSRSRRCAPPACSSSTGSAPGCCSRYAADAPFLSSLPDAGPLTAGFPSSTATSLTSLGTGTPPGHHGMVGITMRVGSGRRARLLHTLHWTAVATNPPVDLRDDFPPEGVQPDPTALERAAAAGVGVTVVSARRFENSGLTRAALRGGTFRGVIGAGRPRRRDDHRSARARPPALLRLPRRPRRARARARPGVAAVADAARRRRPAGRTHRGPPAVGRGAGRDRRPRDDDGRPQGRHRHDPGPDARRRPRRRRRRAPGWSTPDPAPPPTCSRRGGRPSATAPSSSPREQAVDEGWFGAVSPRVVDRLGDVIAAARGGTALTRTRVEPGLAALVGQHGGLTADEQLVPLLLAHNP